MTNRAFSFALALTVMAAPASALTLSFPAAVTQTADEQAPGPIRLPIAPFDGVGVAVQMAEGQVTQQAWRLAAGGLTTAQILGPLKTQLRNDGFDILFECQDRVCGGYDFRFAAGVLPEPAMHVDLGDYRYLLAHDGADEMVALMISRSPSNGFVQMTRVGAAQDEQDVVVTSTKSTDQVLSGPLLVSLSETGRAPLEDVMFQTGLSDLKTAEIPSLRAVAMFLSENPDQNITLVGHTDTLGGLEGNMALSKRRAQAVLEALVNTHGVARERISAEGVAYLAPRASNTTDEGRRANRRVEVILNN